MEGLRPLRTPPIADNGQQMVVENYGASELARRFAYINEKVQDSHEKERAAFLEDEHLWLVE